MIVSPTRASDGRNRLGMKLEPLFHLNTAYFPSIRTNVPYLIIPLPPRRAASVSFYPYIMYSQIPQKLHIFTRVCLITIGTLYQKTIEVKYGKCEESLKKTLSFFEMVFYNETTG